jgi:glycerol-3-phosphate acyltransferase PlsY
VKGMAWVLAARHVGHVGPGALAVTGVAVVAGHSFPFFARDYAGRGLAASAGVLLILLPVEMLVAGGLILLGIAIRAGGLFSTIGMASVPPVAAVQGQTAVSVEMGAAILVLILVRRLQGVGDVIRGGVSPGRAVLYRCLFDSSGPPPRQRGPRRYRATREGEPTA